MGLWDEYMHSEGWKEYERQRVGEQPSNDDTLTRCSWCDRPMIFHPLRKRIKHGLFCLFALHEPTYRPVPVFRRPSPPLPERNFMQTPTMPITSADEYMLARCLYLEDRSGGYNGMVAVGSVVRNRVLRDRCSYYAEVVRRLQFSSITAKGDPELTLYPGETDPAWVEAQAIAASIIDGSIADTTQGATLYYAASIPFPAHWDRAKVTATVSVGNQHFFTETA